VDSYGVLECREADIQKRLNSRSANSAFFDAPIGRSTDMFRVATLIQDAPVQIHPRGGMMQRSKIRSSKARLVVVFLSGFVMLTPARGQDEDRTPGGRPIGVYPNARERARRRIITMRKRLKDTRIDEDREKKRTNDTYKRRKEALEARLYEGGFGAPSNTERARLRSQLASLKKANDYFNDEWRLKRKKLADLEASVMQESKRLDDAGSR
jgi:hypothetical protein